MNINTLIITTNITTTTSREGGVDGKLNRVHFLLPAYQATAKHADDSDGAAEFINAEDGDAVWVPPEAAGNDDDDDTNHLGAHTNDDDDDDGDDDEWHDGISWGQPSSSDSEPSPSPSPSPREERHTGMLRAMDRQLKMLTTRFLASAGISLPREDDGGEGWLDIVTALSWEAALLIKPDGKAGNEMDPGSYIKVKRVATGTRRQCEVINGLVFRKYAAHKHMPTKCHNPKLLLLRGALGDSDVGLSSFDSMEQEKDHLEKAISQVMEKCGPDVILVEKTVSRDIQELLLNQGVTLVLDMKLDRLQRIARCSGSPIVSVLDIMTTTKLKQCDYFHIEKVTEEHNGAGGEGGKRPLKTLMFLEGFPRPLGCTILLRGANSEELKKVKQVMLYTVFAAYHLVLEASFFEDQRVFLNDGSAPNSVGVKEGPSFPVSHTENDVTLTHNRSLEHNSDAEASSDALYSPTDGCSRELTEGTSRTIHSNHALPSEKMLVSSVSGSLRGFIDKFRRQNIYLPVTSQETADHQKGGTPELNQQVPSEGIHAMLMTDGPADSGEYTDSLQDFQKQTDQQMLSDLNPLWMATGANFQIIDVNNNVRTIAAKEFFLGYRKVDLKADEILLSVILPWTRPYEYIKEFKQAHRREDDIALVNAGMRMHITEAEGNWIVSDVSIVYGGVAAVPLTAAKTEKFLVGKKLDDGLLDETFNFLKEDIPLAENAPGGMVEFRSSLTLSFFFKFFLHVMHEMNIKGLWKVGLDAANMSAIQSYTRPVSIGTQGYESVGQGTAVGQSMVHMSAMLQVTGEAEYVDDTPTPPNNLHAALVLSKKAHARILSIDDSVAKCSPGFAGLFLSKDVPGSNHIGPIIHDEEVFASDIVTCVGQIIGIVVADTHDNAKAAANKVNIEYSELPAILSIAEAVKAGSFHPNTTRCISNGDVEQCFSSNTCDKIIEGEIRVGGQEHFYMEPQCTFVWPVDSGNEIHMISSTQAPQKHQKYVANALGLPLSKVVCKTKRIGGGFGGKETRSAIFAAAASVASYCLRRPVKIVLDRDVDMMTTGQRHSFLGKYKVGFTNDGKILALDLEIYNNGGNSLDLSLAVLERAVFHSENVYAIPNIRVSGKVCFTNLPSNTAFRGFGGPQGMLIAENWIHHMATELKRSPEEIKELNFQSEGTEVYYGQLLRNCTMHSVWDELKASCNLLEARKAVNVFNNENRWRKRGIAMVPTKFGISFTAKFMNQAGALVQVYTDGTVLVTHGGVEMGQGLHTKVAQVAASSLDIPLSCVFISETSTDKVPNASPTAASASSDLYGAAVLDACQQIKARMEPIASRGNHMSFAELAQACYMERVDLSAHGFYITPDIGFDWIAGKGSPFNYFTYGAAFAEVEIDTLTGDFHTRTADIVMDLGYSINPAIDIGQIEGAFIQGLGWAAMEELKWGDDNHKWIRPGHLFTCGPGSYKIPSINDIPLNFKVSLLKGVPNPRAIHSSKAVGEPPFFLASAVLFAIKDAIAAARAEEGHLDWFPLDNPATPERIRMACVDSITKKFASVYYRPKLSV